MVCKYILFNMCFNDVWVKILFFYIVLFFNIYLDWDYSIELMRCLLVEL